MPGASDTPDRRANGSANARLLARRGGGPCPPTLPGRPPSPPAGPQATFGSCLAWARWFPRPIAGVSRIAVARRAFQDRAGLTARKLKHVVPRPPEVSCNSRARCFIWRSCCSASAAPQFRCGSTAAEATHRRTRRRIHRGPSAKIPRSRTAGRQRRLGRQSAFGRLLAPARSPQSRPDAAPRRALNPARSEAPRRSSATPRDEDTRSRTLKSRDGGSYRTVCVRLCDGYFWPVSFAAGRTSLEQDQRKCEQSCESPVRLYTAKDAEAPLEEMRDENGRYYRDLKTAFVYRSSYLENCKCRAHPWEAEAQARHAGYAQEVKPNRRQR